MADKRSVFPNYASLRSICCRVRLLLGAAPVEHAYPRLNDRGSVMAEYVVVLTAVGLGCALATASLGAPLLSAFLGQKDWILLPFP